jgi:predicted permease
MATDDITPANVLPEGFQLPQGREALTLFSARVDENYFDTMKIPIVRGRGFRQEDSTGAQRVAIVNEQYVQHYLPNEDPIGKRFQLRERAGLTWIEIVGVAKTTKYLWLGEPPTEYVYLPFRQNPREDMVLLTETAGDPTDLVTPLRELVQEFDRTLPIYNVRTMEQFYQMRTITIFNVIVGIVAAMGLMGLGLAIVGLYGLVAYATSRRTKEIGIRMAIGAGRYSVLRMVLNQGLVLAIIGLVVGLLAGVGVERLLQAAFPSEDNRIEVMAYLFVAPVVLAATFIAAYLPARRAARLDPMKALRYE